ncbi:cell division protein ZapB [Mesorhizobium amorphae]|uniref:cell division protein ZapB n=1 Tax=Mesorhizobium amorphae TaxID=71433 RepID=UPI00177BA896|nr:cell division protein ZapB [Mesorhizobium amorphae]
MAKKPMMTREELLAQLDALDNSTEVGKLTAEVSRLTEENASLLSQRRELERQLKQERDALQTIREALCTVDVQTRTYGADRPGYAEMQAASERSSLMALAEVQHGMRKGTHDPATGLPYTADTQPPRDLTSGAPKVTKGELERFFPSLSGASVDVTTTAATLLDAELGDAKSALGIGEYQTASQHPQPIA